LYCVLNTESPLREVPLYTEMHIELVITSVIQSCVQYPELQELVDRQFCEAGDSSLARRLVLKVILEGEGSSKHKRN